MVVTNGGAVPAADQGLLLPQLVLGRAALGADLRVPPHPAAAGAGAPVLRGQAGRRGVRVGDADVGLDAVEAGGERGRRARGADLAPLAHRLLVVRRVEDLATLLQMTNRKLVSVCRAR